MSHRIIHRIGTGIIIGSLVGGAALAAPDTPEDKTAPDAQRPRHEVTVTANRIETPLRETGSSVTVIQREDLERTGKTTVIEALEAVAPLNLLQNGPAGAQTAVQIRGSESQHVKILLDGVEINDPSTPARTVNLAHLLVENISRIEIVAGPQSPLYGSDALGGVIQIITREKTGPPHIRVSAQGGSYGTLAGTAELSGGADVFRYSLGFGQHRSDGFSAAGSAYQGNSEADGYRNLSLFGKLGVFPRKNLELRFSFRFTDAETELDNYGGDFGDDPNNIEDTRNVVLNGEARGRFWNNRWESRLRAAVMTHERTYDNPVDDRHAFDSDNSVYQGGLFKLEWQNNLFLHESNTFTFGMVHTREQAESEYHSLDMWGPYDSLFPEENASNTGVYVQDHLRLGGILFATLGGRWDSHSQAGDSFTFRAAPSILIESTGTRFKASLGTGFKAPTLYQLYAPATLYGPVGNSGLEAEESRGWDAGVEQTLLGGNMVMEAVYFDNRFDNLIDYDFSRGYVNIAEASTSGFEFKMRARPFDSVSLQAGYVHTDAEDVATGEKLIRRPEHKLTARLGWRFSRRIDLSLGLIHVGERTDNFFQGWTSTRVTMDPYTLVEAAASCRVLEGLRLFLRIDNLLDREYEVIKGYGAPGFSAFGGIKLDL